MFVFAFHMDLLHPFILILSRQRSLAVEIHLQGVSHRNVTVVILLLNLAGLITTYFDLLSALLFMIIIMRADIITV